MGQVWAIIKIKTIGLGTSSDAEVRMLVDMMLSGKGPTTPELFKLAHPYHLPEYRTKVEIGQAAPDAKVHNLDGSATQLLSHLGNGPTVVNFGSYT